MYRILFNLVSPRINSIRTVSWARYFGVGIVNHLVYLLYYYTVTAGPWILLDMFVYYSILIYGKYVMQKKLWFVLLVECV